MMHSVPVRLLLTFLLVLSLTIAPMPQILEGSRPAWVLLLMLYLQFYLRDYFNLILLFLIGFYLDLLLSTVIGEHILALTMVAWFASPKARRFYLFPVGQQMLLIGFLCFIYQLILFTVDAFLGFHLRLVAVIASPLFSVLLWPWVSLAAKRCLTVRV